MAKNNSKMVEAITPMNEDFAKWYTDICKGLYGYPPLRICDMGKYSENS